MERTVEPRLECCPDALRYKDTGLAWVEVCTTRRRDGPVPLDCSHRHSHATYLVESDWPFCPRHHDRCLNSILMAAGRVTSMRAKGAQIGSATSPRASSRWSASGRASPWPVSPLHPPCCGQASPGCHSPRLMIPCPLSPTASSRAWASAQTVQVGPSQKAPWVTGRWQVARQLLTVSTLTFVLVPPYPHPTPPRSR